VSVRLSGVRPRRYDSIAGLARVPPARQLISFWLAVGLTFASLGSLIDVIARGRSAPVILVLNVVFAARRSRASQKLTRMPAQAPIGAPGA
jgi:hypothetical protein